MRGPIISSPSIAEQDLRNRSASEIRAFANQLGLLVDRRRPDRFLDPVTGFERLRIDPGHIDATTGLPYVNPRAAVPHVHGYPPDGPRSGKIIDTQTNDPHFPLRQDIEARAV